VERGWSVRPVTPDAREIVLGGRLGGLVCCCLVDRRADSLCLAFVVEQLTALTLGMIRCNAFSGADRDDGQACTRIDWKEEKTGFSLVIEAFGPLSLFVRLKSRQSNNTK